MDEAIATLIASDDRARALVGESIEPWVVHDIRRSLATGCQAMGVALAHTEAILNHVSGKRQPESSASTTLYDYYDEKADALDKWGALIAAALKCLGRGRHRRHPWSSIPRAASAGDDGQGTAPLD